MTSINKTARLAGSLYLMLVPLGVFGILYVPSLITPGDAAATASKIIASESLVRLSIVTAFLAAIVNIFVVLLLYELLKPVSKDMASLMVIFILVAIPIGMLNELNHFAVLSLLNGADYSAAVGADEPHAQVMFFLNLHEHGINIAMILWGLWLLPMGYLVFKSGFLPRILGVLLMIGFVGYLVDSVVYFLVPDSTVTVAQFTFIGEVLFPLWLLIKGVNVAKWEEAALGSTAM